MSSLSMNATAQGNNWKLDGNNNGSNTTFLGTTTNQPLVFKTNNAERFRINGAGQFTFTGLNAGFLTLGSTGVLQSTPFTGNANQVLLGNGTFGTVPGLTNYFSLSSPTQIFTNYKLGIGVSQPQQMLEVNGNGVFNGTLTAQSINLAEVSYAGKTLFFKPNGMCMDGYDLTTNTLNEICGITQPLYINSKAGLSQNTILNAGNNSSVGIGTANPQGKLDVNGASYFRNSIYATSLDTTVVDTTTINQMQFLFLDQNNKVVRGDLKTLKDYVYAGSLPNLNPCGFLVDSQGNPIEGTPTWQNSPGKIYTLNTQCIDVKVGIGIVPKAKLHIKLSPGSDTKPIVVQNDAGYKVFQVNTDGLVYAREVKVNLESAWPDYVFETGYKLTPLAEVKQYIALNKHLPNVPSAEEVKENGLSLGEGNKILLEKVEELTLYLIQMEETMKAQAELLKAQQEQIKLLQTPTK